MKAWQNGASLNTGSYPPRISPLPADRWDESIRKFKIGKILNAYKTIAHHPRLFRRWLPFADQVLNKNTVPGRLREIVVLRTGWNCGSGYEWGQHVEIGRLEGLTDEDIVRITRGSDAPGWTSLEALLLRAVDEIHEDDVVSDRTYEALADELSIQQLLDLVFLVGHYRLVATLFNTFRVERDDDVTGLPFPGDN